MISEEARQLIHKCIQGQLTPEETKNLEKHLKDKEFRDEVAMRGATKLALELLEKEEDEKLLTFLSELDEAAEKMPKPKSPANPGLTKVTTEGPTKEGSAKIRRLLPRHWQIAAAVVVILAVGKLTWDQLNFSSNEVFALAEEPENYDREARGGPEKEIDFPGNDILLQCNIRPENKGSDLNKYILCLNEMDKDSTKYGWYTYNMLGYSYLFRRQDNDLENALSAFENSIKHLEETEGLNPTLDPIRWNRLITLILLESPLYNESLERFLNHDQSEWREKAKDLKKKLKFARNR